MILKLFYGVNEQLKSRAIKCTDLCLSERHDCVPKYVKQLRRFTTNCYLTFANKVFTLGLLQIHIAFVASKAVVDQQTAESQVSSSQVAQQRIGSYDYSAPLIDDHDHHHHHEEHDPGFWKKKVTWKEGWKKYWVSLIEDKF